MRIHYTQIYPIYPYTVIDNMPSIYHELYAAVPTQLGNSWKKTTRPRDNKTARLIVNLFNLWSYCHLFQHVVLLSQFDFPNTWDNKTAWSNVISLV